MRVGWSAALSGQKAQFKAEDATGLTMQQPEDERQGNTDDQARCDRKIEAKVAALDHDIAGQPTETELAEPGPQQADNDER